MLICGKPNFARVSVGAGDFLAVMRAAVDFQDVVVKIFHAQAQARHAQFADGLELVVGERARLGFEGDLLGFIPRHNRLHAIDEMPELVHGKIGRRAAAEINEVRFAAADGGLGGVDGEFLQRGSM